MVSSGVPQCARDEELPPPRPLVGRLARAQANFLETFPIMIAVAMGVPYVRSLAWGVALLGIVLVLKPALVAAF